MKLLIEENQNVEVLNEEDASGAKSMFIEGHFIQTEKRNINKRVYPRAMMEAVYDRYMEDVRNKKALGEMNHPPYPMPNAAKAAIMVTEMKWDGDNVYGKAKVLNTSIGKDVQALLNDGVRLGVSTRGLGTVNAQGIVQPGFVLNAIDVVHRPSGQDCEISPIMESQDEWINENGVWVRQNAIEEHIDFAEIMRKALA